MEDQIEMAGSLVRVELPFAPHVLGSAPHAGEAGDKAREAIWEMFWIVTYPCAVIGAGRYSDTVKKWGRMPRGMREALAKLSSSLEEATKEAFDNGKRHGASSLQRLVDGEITIKDLEKATGSKP